MFKISSNLSRFEIFTTVVLGIVTSRYIFSDFLKVNESSEKENKSKSEKEDK